LADGVPVVGRAQQRRQQTGHDCAGYRSRICGNRILLMIAAAFTNHVCIRDVRLRIKVCLMKDSDSISDGFSQSVVWRYQVRMWPYTVQNSTTEFIQIWFGAFQYAMKCLGPLLKPVFRFYTLYKASVAFSLRRMNHHVKLCTLHGDQRLSSPLSRQMLLPPLQHSLTCRVHPT
jgi:hypothetical protein